jgi:flagellar protein FliS
MDAYRQYQTQAVSTASPAQLVQMLYQGALGAVTRAEQVLTDGGTGSIEAAHTDLVKAQDIITELAVSLDHEQGGDIAANLASLYTYCLEQLQQANLHKDAGPLPPVRNILAELSDAWGRMRGSRSCGPR